MQCVELSEEQHTILQELQRGREGKRFGRTINTVAGRLQQPRSEILSVCEELQDLRFVTISDLDHVEFLQECSCASRTGARTGARAARTTNTNQVQTSENKNTFGVLFPSAPGASPVTETACISPRVNPYSGQVANTSPGPRMMDSDVETQPRRKTEKTQTKVCVEDVVKAKSKRRLKAQQKRWYPVDGKWNGVDLANYFKYQVVARFPGKDTRVPVTTLAKELGEWMKLDEAVNPELVKQMIDLFVEDDRNVDSNIPAWKSFLNARKRLLRALDERSVYDYEIEYDADVEDAPLDSVTAKLLGL